jgi:hypothetical protein
MNNINVWRQGDVYLLKVDALPKGCRVKNNILANGSVTGHKHQFLSKDVKTYIKNGVQYCVLCKVSVLFHEEHNKIIIPKGIYEVRIQREFDIVEGIRKVSD